MRKSIYSKDYQKIIRRLKKARLECDITQLEIAKKINKPQSFISKIESGERRIDISELKIILKVYDKNVQSILGD